MVAYPTFEMLRAVIMRPLYSMDDAIVVLQWIFEWSRLLLD